METDPSRAPAVVLQRRLYEYQGKGKEEEAMTDGAWENLVKLAVLIGVITGLAFLMGGTILIWLTILRWVQ